MIVSVPGTSANLGPGFDALGLAVDLRNTIEIKPSRFFSISVKGEGANFLKMKGSNIFLNIFNDLYKQLGGKRPDRYRFVFDNNIPISRGLGSSSAVIVSAIAAAHHATGKPVDKKKILDMALKYESHPDNITPAVHGGFNAAVVENRKVRNIRKEIPDTVKAVIVIPDKPISTKASRTSLPKKIFFDEAVYNLGRASMVTACFISGEFELLRYAARDRLHQHSRMSKLPVLFDVQKTAWNHGALMSTLSGSGSTFFSMAYNDDAPALHAALEERFPKFKVKTLEFDNEGLTLQD